MPKRKSKRKPKVAQEFLWVIAYIDYKYASRAERELEKFLGIEVRIPTIKVLKKTFKKKNHFEEKPILFNYGFFRVPKMLALNPEYMAKVKNYVSCIKGWVKDPLSLEIGGLPNPNNIATCTEKELLILFQEAEEDSVFTEAQIDALKEGQEIIMRGYPFEGILAKILKIDRRKEEVEVEIKTFGFAKSIKVQYENLLYNIYKNGYDDSLSNHLSLDELNDKKRTQTLNKILSDGTE